MVKNTIKYCSNIHVQGAKPNIFLFATPRSGSTLLMELICSQKAVKYCDEPLNLRSKNVQRAVGFGNWGFSLPFPGRELIYKKYFSKIIKGQVPFLNPNPLKKGYHFFTDRMVLKILHGGEDLIDWFRATFRADVIYLVRHPIAVTLSRKQCPRLPFFLENETFCSFLNPMQIKASRQILTESDDFERGILSWCLQNFHQLKVSNKENWIFISYEQLVMEPKRVISYLANKLQLEERDSMIDRIKVPSRTVELCDEETKKAFCNNRFADLQRWLVEKWKKKVTRKQIARTFEILDTFQIDTYSIDGTYPHSSILI
jgi:hypothetical protein